MQNNKKQGDKGHITKGRYCEIYKIPPTRMVGSDERIQNKRTLRQTSIAAMERTRKKQDHVKDGETRFKKTEIKWE